MNKLILSICIITASFTIDAQVGIGTTHPQSTLDIVSTTSGVLIPRIATTAAVTTPLNGMLIYDLSTNCFKGYENDGWSDCLSAIGANSSVTNDCNQNGFEGAYVGGIALGNSNDFTVTITNNTFNTVPLSLNVNDLVLSGTAVGSISVASVSPTSVSLSAGQTQVITYQLSGTPVVGTLQADWTKITLSCSKIKNVGVGDATFELPTQASIVSVNDGTPLVDIQGVIDNGSNQLVVNVPYVNGLGTYSAYSSSVVNSAAGTGENGDVNGFSISYPAGSFGTSGTIPVTITVDGDGAFNAAKQLFGVSETIATIDFQFNGDYKGKIVLVAIGGVVDRNFADANHKFVYIPVMGEDGNIWLNNNLGAHYSNLNHGSYNPNQQATTHNDHLAYGSLYQWGRFSDGHELINWTDATSGTAVNGTTFTNATTNTPVDASFILESAEPKDWRVPQNNALWQGEVGVNNPCPQGYRLPTSAEYRNLKTTSAANITDSTTAASSDLAFTTPGYRNLTDGTFKNQSSIGRYWTNELWLFNSIYSSIIQIITETNFYDTAFKRAYGISVRCIKDY